MERVVYADSINKELTNWLALLKEVCLIPSL